MPKYANELGTIDLSNYKKVKELTNGKTNSVHLWEHKENSHLKIVVKMPYGSEFDLIQHNIRAINAFFGADSAWPINGKVDGKPAFAMKYYQGMSLTSDEIGQLINNDQNSLRTVNKNGLTFTILDPNQDNFLKLPTGEFIPIDFDYMIIHDGKGLLPYQQTYLEGRMGFAMRVGDCSTQQAARYVLDSYPNAASYLLEHWGKRYLSNKPEIKPALVQNKPLQPMVIPKKTRAHEQNFNNKVDALLQKISDFENKPEHQEAHKAASILHTALKQEGKKYFAGKQSKDSYQTFKGHCEALITTARTELDKHRGWSKILFHILAAVFTAGVGYAIAVGINMAINKGRCTFFSTDSSIKINQIEDSIHEAAPAA
jgi:hypothetical protein